MMYSYQVSYVNQKPKLLWQKPENLKFAIKMKMILMKTTADILDTQMWNLKKCRKFDISECDMTV